MSLRVTSYLLLMSFSCLFQKLPDNISHLQSVSRKYEEEILKLFYFTSLVTR